MENTLLTKVSTYSLNLFSEDIKSKVNSYLVIGSISPEDKDLIAKLDDNDINNNLTYKDIVDNNWYGFEGQISSSYYDHNNFLTFDIRLPYEKVFNVYIYAFALLENKNANKNIISITRSPSIFNKTKYSSGVFSIKFTFSQEDNTKQKYQSDLFESKFVSKEYAFIAEINANSDIITADRDISSLNIGTKIYSEHLNTPIVIIDTITTDKTLSIYQARISKKSQNTNKHETIFIEKTIKDDNSYITKDELKHILDNFHQNNLYYLYGSTVQNSFLLNGNSSDYYANKYEIDDIKKKLANVVTTNGSTITGNLFITRPESVEYAKNEIVPLYYIEKLLLQLKAYVNSDFKYEVINTLDSNKEELNNRIDNAINEYSVFKNKILSSFHNQDLFNNSLDEKIDTKVNYYNTQFSERPTINDTYKKLNELHDNTVLAYKDIKELMSKFNRTIEIDLRDYDTDYAYPVAFNNQNEPNQSNYTDSLLWKEQDSHTDSMFKLRFFGNGFKSHASCGVLDVQNYHVGRMYFIQQIYAPSHSSAVIVYLRGGFKYFVNLRGTDDNPTYPSNDSESIHLVDSAVELTREAWDRDKYLNGGSWTLTNFNLVTDIKIDRHLKNTGNSGSQGLEYGHLGVIEEPPPLPTADEANIVERMTTLEQRVSEIESVEADIKQKIDDSIQQFQDNLLGAIDGGMRPVVGEGRIGEGRIG